MSEPARGRRALFIAAAVLAMIAAAILASEIFRSTRETREFHVPDAAEAERAKTLLADALAGRGDWTARLDALGLEARRVADAADLAIREAEGRCRGSGVYRLRDEGGEPLALVAPHRGADRRTGTLATLLYEEIPAAAAAWSSAPRRPTRACPGGGDPTRVETHFLTSFSLAFAEAHPYGRIVQLHGFDRGRRTSRAAQLAHVIVSSGDSDPGAALLDLTDCLSVELDPLRVALYPRDTRELGATSNRQGRALREAGFAGFVHLELSAELRERLVRDRGLRTRLADCLTSGLA